MVLARLFHFYILVLIHLALADAVVAVECVSGINYEVSAKASSPRARRTSCGATSCSAAVSCDSRRGKASKPGDLSSLNVIPLSFFPVEERKVGSDEAVQEKKPVKLSYTNYVGVYSRMLEPRCFLLDLKRRDRMS